jgi:SpoVK/Ycf46/Vps4 family AAA+-type ATPase
LSTLVKGISSLDSQTDVDYVTLASKTEGYSISDLGDLINNTLQQCMIRSAKEDLSVVSYFLLKKDLAEYQQRITMADFEMAQAAFTPISLRGVTLQKSSVQWSDIGGKLFLPDSSDEADKQVYMNLDGSCARLWNGRQNTPRSLRPVHSVYVAA